MAKAVFQLCYNTQFVNESNLWSNLNTTLFNVLLADIISEEAVFETIIVYEKESLKFFLWCAWITLFKNIQIENYILCILVKLFGQIYTFFMDDANLWFGFCQY